jgi:hypothetical protein
MSSEKTLQERLDEIAIWTETRPGPSHDYCRVRPEALAEVEAAIRADERARMTMGDATRAEPNHDHDHAEPASIDFVLHIERRLAEAEALAEQTRRMLQGLLDGDEDRIAVLERKIDLLTIHPASQEFLARRLAELDERLRRLESDEALCVPMQEVGA